MTNEGDDRHVLAAAVYSGSHAIVTENVKHFPQGSLKPYGIELVTADEARARSSCSSSPASTLPKGKLPSLLAISTGTPERHACRKATPCGRCEEIVIKGQRRFKIPKVKSGFTGHLIFCFACTIAIIEQTKIELLVVESSGRERRVAGEELGGPCWI
jgi:hypothetical protein